jgi:hypothetical protein
MNNMIEKMIAAKSPKDGNLLLLIYLLRAVLE